MAVTKKKAMDLAGYECISKAIRPVKHQQIQAQRTAVLVTPVKSSVRKQRPGRAVPLATMGHVESATVVQMSAMAPMSELVQMLEELANHKRKIAELEDQVQAQSKFIFAADEALLSQKRRSITVVPRIVGEQNKVNNFEIKFWMGSEPLPQ